MRKDIFVFAGANGSGKSTVIDFYMAKDWCPMPYICPDQLVPPDKKNDIDAYLQAMVESEKRRMLQVTLGKSFTFETVLSRAEKLEFLRFAKNEGYFITAIYVVTSDPQINIERVKKRVEQGGHGVPIEKIVPRYERAMQLMPEVLNLADEGLIYDNSGEKPIVLYAKYKDGRVYWIDPVPTWLQKYM